jgi:hypothetical protein
MSQIGHFFVDFSNNSWSLLFLLGRDRSEAALAKEHPGLTAV